MCSSPKRRTARLYRNVVTTMRNPLHLFWWLRYHCSRLLHDGNAHLSIAPNVQLGSFVNYTEYFYSRYFLNDAERNFCTKHPFPDGSILDVGANIGAFASVLATRYPRRTVYAFEPNPYTSPALEQNAALNHLNNIQIHGCAVAANDGKVRFIADAHCRATCRIGMAQEPCKVEVDAVTLDTFCRQQSLHNIAVLKIDVEGFESDVLRGAHNLLRNNPPFYVIYEISLENSRTLGRDPFECTTILQDCGYSINRLDRNGQLNEIDPRKEDVTLDNWIAHRA